MLIIHYNILLRYFLSIFYLSTYTNKSDYDNYGNWYHYNGNSYGLHHVLTTFDPKKDKVMYLISKLETECEVEKYESTVQILWRWSQESLTFIGAIPAAILTPTIKSICSMFIC